ncbi:helix-turn-helix domain-containing protein [Microtetraspora sp. AC03309]|uniref:PucR family transcriptional regulator n=1 Tax=Microtetraspora sp. AC03309 TaxID=2779376 RepID=UPI001E4F17CA|nr:helix-turn-helix domain-containing protein [Microtetraspora sp. AC03309]MCC5574253.1 helix-turn-helix domain-containing protein [Microtetraspora sp. AC03309]
MVVLGQLLDILGTLGTCECRGPVDRDTKLRGLALYDPSDPQMAAGDQVMLGVGIDTPAGAAGLLSRGDAAVVVLRGRFSLDEGVARAAREAGTPVVLVDPGVSWGQLVAVIHTLVFGEHAAAKAAAPGGLFDLADTIAGAVDGSVTIEDVQARVLAYSHRQQDVDQARLLTILGRRVPDETLAALRTQGVFAHLDDSDEPLFVPALSSELTARVVVAVRAGRELLGSVWVEVDQPLSPGQNAALVAGARVAATHLLTSRASADLERRVEADLVRSLIEGAADAPAALLRLGLPATDLRVIALRADGGADAVLLAARHATVGFTWARPGRSALVGDVLYTVLSGGKDADAARAWVRALARDLPSDATLWAGIGGPADLSQLPASRSEADESLAVHMSDPDTELPVTYDAVWDRILLRRLAGAAAAGRMPTSGPVVDLARHDAEHGTEYVPTLRALLRAQGDLREASARLAVHPNTVRYRLRKMSEATRLELDDPRKRLAMMIALEAGAAMSE